MNRATNRFPRLEFITSDQKNMKLPSLQEIPLLHQKISIVSIFSKIQATPQANKRKRKTKFQALQSKIMWKLERQKHNFILLQHQKPISTQQYNFHQLRKSWEIIDQQQTLQW